MLSVELQGYKYDVMVKAYYKGITGEKPKTRYEFGRLITSNIRPHVQLKEVEYYVEEHVELALNAS